MPEKFRQERHVLFRAFKRILPIRYKRPRFIFLGEHFGNGGIIISNHAGTDAPLSLELYCDKPIRMWGAHEMNAGLATLYRYQTRVYYHEKKHWNLHLARLFCLLASPLTFLFYKGLRLIPTYHDARFVKTLRESIAAIKHDENIVIFPEDSSEGYKDVLDGFLCGFLTLADHCYREGIDVPIYVAYFRKKDGIYFVDAPVRYSQLLAEHATKEEMAARLVARCNALGRSDPNTPQTATLPTEPAVV